MSLLLLLQTASPARDARAAALESDGHRVVAAPAEWTALRAALDAHAFHALLVDCSDRPSHARECALYLAERKATRDLPLFLLDVKPPDFERTKSKLPSARIVTEATLPAALANLPATAPAPPPDPTQAFRKRFDLADGYVLVGRGVEFRAALTRALGPTARFQTTAPRDVQTAVVELPLDTPDLAAFFATWQTRLAPAGALWVISPKKDHARREACPHTWDAVQKAALSTNLVDTKIAAFSENLTATRFVIRKERRGGARRKP